ncbi:MAG: sulfur transferase domain-containing protein [Pseudomonadota bacterium]
MSPELKRLYRRVFPSRREERTAYFEPPLVGWPRRAHAWLDMLFIDHGFIRFFYSNFHQVDERLYRSSQPLPHQVARWGQRGIKTIINLRGGRQFGSYPLELEAAEKASIRLVDLQLRSRALPTLEELEALERLFQEITYPAVVHCKAGADRASLASALYFLIVHEDADKALGQMTIKFGHIKGSKTGVLDAMIETYLRDGAPRGQSFMTWVRDGYSPEAIAAAFRPNLFGSFFGDTILQRE